MAELDDKVNVVKGLLVAVDAIRDKAEELMADLLVEAAKDIAARHPGHRVEVVSAMGRWFGVAHCVNVEDEDGETGTVDLVYGSDGDEDVDHPVFTLFSEVWDEIGAHPTLRVTVAEDGTLTKEIDW